jgi:hypothetical protein
LPSRPWSRPWPSATMRCTSLPMQRPTTMRTRRWKQHPSSLPLATLPTSPPRSRLRGRLGKRYPRSLPLATLPTSPPDPAFRRDRRRHGARGPARG